MTLADICSNNQISYNTLRGRLSTLGISDEEVRERYIAQMVKKNGMEIYQYDKDGNYVRSYSSINEAIRITGIHHIDQVVRGERRIAGGYLWSSEKSDRIAPYCPNKKYIPKPVCQYTPDWTFVAEYPSATTAERICGVHNVSRACRKDMCAGGYRWKYKAA